MLQLAKGYNAALKGKPYQEPAAVAPQPLPLTIKDQVDLRWLLSQDWQWLMIQATMLATARSASADRHYLPWLSDALKRLSPTVAVAELEEIAEQWRNDAAATSTINPRSSSSLNCCRAGPAPGGGGAGTTAMNRSRCSGAPSRPSHWEQKVGRVRPAGLPEWCQAGTPLGCSDGEPRPVGGGSGAVFTSPGRKVRSNPSRRSR